MKETEKKEIEKCISLKRVNTVVLKESIVGEHFLDTFEQENLERCPDCGSSIFRIYNEPVKEGRYEQIICAVCNHRLGGWLNDYKTELKSISGRICRKCGDELEKE